MNLKWLLTPLLLLALAGCGAGGGGGGGSDNATTTVGDNNDGTGADGEGTGDDGGTTGGGASGGDGSGSSGVDCMTTAPTGIAAPTHVETGSSYAESDDGYAGSRDDDVSSLLSVCFAFSDNSVT